MVNRTLTTFTCTQTCEYIYTCTIDRYRGFKLFHEILGKHFQEGYLIDLLYMIYQNKLLFLRYKYTSKKKPIISK